MEIILWWTCAVIVGLTFLLSISLIAMVAYYCIFHDGDKWNGMDE